ncbi:MAG: IPT/TIG domain-containing protein, partial [Candidatus Nomurabacteria bacterium]|nr:IPT/TIG domain-containing protein [Candidatus Nomurabacteria bacterium]
MKNKYLLTVKFALASILLGAIGLVLAPPAEPVGAASTVLTVEVEAGIDFEVEKPTSSQKSSQVIPIYTKGLNVSTVDVYVDLNKDGIFDPSEALGVFTVNSSGSYGPAYLGSVKLPDGTAYGEYTMQFVAHPLMNSASLGDVTVTRKIIYAKDAPRIISINPNYGPNTGGTEVTITGEYLEGTTKVEFDGKECKIVSTSATAVICITPSHVSGKVDVVLFSPDGNAVLKDGFLYFAEKSV